jgi:hypothetical protein
MHPPEKKSIVVEELQSPVMGLPAGQMGLHAARDLPANAGE